MRSAWGWTMILLVVVASACTPKATSSDCRAACDKQAALQKPATPAPDAVAELDAEYRAKIDAALKAKVDALAVLDAELAARLAAVAQEEEQAALKQEYAARRSAKEEELQPAINALGNQRDEVVEAARQARDKAQADARTAAERARTACVDACVRAGTPRPVTDCRQNAMSQDELDACK